MKLVDWILENRPGKASVENGKIEIAHDSGEHSTLWLNQLGTCPIGLERLDDTYTEYDGIDLFSSTFKIASIKESKAKGEVEITPTLQDLNEELSEMMPNLPEGAIPFMVQQGIGIYFIARDGLIYEWDSELGELTTHYADLLSIFEEWLSAVQ